MTSVTVDPKVLSEALNAMKPVVAGRRALRALSGGAPNC